MNKTVDLCIPVYRPGDEFAELIKRIAKQTYPVSCIRICNTERELWTAEAQSALEKSGISFTVRHIPKPEFDHGSVRDDLIRSSQADYVLFMTMDALPADDSLVMTMAAALSEDEKRAVCYARQLARPGADIIEKYSRCYNYPSGSREKTIEDVPLLGIKTFFCSNVCAMYRKDAYLSCKGFPRGVIFNEDMICAKALLECGRSIYYEAEARVFHSHDYTLKKQLHRNFDLAFSQEMSRATFEGISSESEGIKYVRVILSKLLRRGRLLAAFRFCMQCAVKYAGFFLGKRAERLPLWLTLRLTDSKEYFKNRQK